MAIRFRERARGHWLDRARPQPAPSWRAPAAYIFPGETDSAGNVLKPLAAPAAPTVPESSADGVGLSATAAPALTWRALERHPEGEQSGSNRERTGGRKRPREPRSGSNRPLRPIPTDPVRIDCVLRTLQGQTVRASKWHRLRSRALLAACVSASPSTTFAALTRMTHQQVRSELRAPREGWRWIRGWLALRAQALGAAAESSPWTSFPPLSAGNYRKLAEGLVRLLESSKVPAWRPSALLLATWGGLTIYSHSEVSR